MSPSPSASGARTQVLELLKLEACWREHASTIAQVRDQAEQRRKLLAEQLAQLDRQVRELGQQADPHAQIERLKRIQGVGVITASTVWAEMPELGEMAPGQASALAGLAPYARDSGRKRGRRYVQAGRTQVRRVLYMAALSASRHNPILSEVYRRLLKRGKPRKVALIAVARRLIELCNQMLKDPNFSLVA